MIYINDNNLFISIHSYFLFPIIDILSREIGPFLTRYLIKEGGEQEKPNRAREPAKKVSCHSCQITSKLMAGKQKLNPDTLTESGAKHL